MLTVSCSEPCCPHRARNLVVSAIDRSSLPSAAGCSGSACSCLFSPGRVPVRLASSPLSSPTTCPVRYWVIRTIDRTPGRSASRTPASSVPWRAATSARWSVAGEAELAASGGSSAGRTDSSAESAKQASREVSILVGQRATLPGWLSHEVGQVQFDVDLRTERPRPRRSRSRPRRWSRAAGTRSGRNRTPSGRSGRRRSR